MVGSTISFICYSAGAVEWESSCFANTVLHQAPLKVTLELALFVISGGLFQLMIMLIYCN